MVLRTAALFTIFVACTRAGKQCYFPSGQLSADKPCDEYAEVSMCCGSPGGCLSNGLCKDGDTSPDHGQAYARGTCTDPLWASPICPQQCRINQDTGKNGSAFDFRLNGVEVWECNAQGYNKPAAYCCESASEKNRCCQTSSAVFSLLPATAGNALPVQTAMPTKPTGAGTHTPTSTPPGHGTPVATNPPSSDGDYTDDVSGDNLRRSLVIGIGVSIGSAFIVGCCVTFLLHVKKRRLRRAENLSNASSPASGSSSFFGGSPLLPSSDEKCVVVIENNQARLVSPAGSVDVSPTSERALTRSSRYTIRTYELA